MTYNNRTVAQSDGNTKYSGTHLLLNGEADLKNYNQWIINKFLRNIQISGLTKVMDFGAGVGTLTKIFFEATGIRPDCVELDPEQRVLIDERGFDSYSGLDELTQKYDLIYTSNVLEHIEHDGLVLKTLKSKLKETGTLIVFVPAFEVIWSTMDDRVGHCRRYTKTMLTEKLVQSGYTVKYIRYCDSVGFVLSFLFKHLGSKNGEPSSAALKIYDNYLLPISKLVDVLLFGKFGKNLIAIATLKVLSEAHQNA